MRLTPWKPSQPAMKSQSSTCAAPSLAIRKRAADRSSTFSSTTSSTSNDGRHAARVARVHEVFRELRLAVDGEARALRREVDAIALLADGDLDAVVLQPFALEPLRHARLAQDRDGALLDDAGAHAPEHVVAAAPLEDDAVDAGALEQLREQQARRPRADDADLRSCSGHAASACYGSAYAISDCASAAPGIVYREPPGRDDRDVLAAVGRRIRDRHGVRRQRQLRDPELGARPRVERAEASIVARADEHEPGRRHDRPAEIEPARAPPAFGQLLREPERHAPDDVARRNVDGQELAPRRLLARPRRRRRRSARCRRSRRPHRSTRSARAARRPRSCGDTAGARCARPRPSAPTSHRAVFGSSQPMPPSLLVLTNTSLRLGSAATPPQLAPPSEPGNTIVERGSSPGARCRYGVNGPEFCKPPLRSRNARQNAACSAVVSAAVTRSSAA